jgi:hypothetical protein
MYVNDVDSLQMYVCVYVCMYICETRLISFLMLTRCVEHLMCVYAHIRVYIRIYTCIDTKREPKKKKPSSCVNIRGERACTHIHTYTSIHLYACEG